MLKLRQGHALAVLLKVAGLSRSTFYYQLNAQQTGDRQAALKARIRALYAQHKGRYGYRRITAALRQAGKHVSHKAVQRMMQTLGLKSLVTCPRNRCQPDAG
ncbi:IS3 family transposase [Alcaligenes sp. SDU_A2]|uniref:IS3 family transposase n=1 Tax=Alcaligenes sp. SDU_A2 TaxID=3136634 RepID=UPI00311D6105